jgi:hypothetical protein
MLAVALNLSTLQAYIMLIDKISLAELLLLETAMLITNSVILVVADE